AKNAAAIAALQALGRGARAFEVDVVSEASCRDFVAAAAQAFGRLDILVNNAGTSIRKPPQSLSAVEWHTVIDTNLTSAFLCAQAAYPFLQRAAGGKIINISSLMAWFGAAFAAPYAASKAGVVQLTRSLAVAWAKDNIQVNAIMPGWIDTPLTRKGRVEIPGFYEEHVTRTPAGRWGTPEDFGGAAVFLASGASQFVTGAVIPIDGGYSIQL
ncbi:MAG: SDR family NAD(P)-dependent oxidoreductase, partial [Opitutaceae bacterium]